MFTKRLFLRITCVSLLLLAVADSTVAARQGHGNLADFVKQGMDLWHVPGMAVAVVNRDGVEFQQGFGRTAISDGAIVDEHTLFAIASTTKAMVVTGILMLVDEGKMSIDDPIVKHLPEVHFSDPMLTRQLMVRDLLAHRTGLPSTDFWTFFQDMPLDEQIRRLDAVPAAAPLRTRLIYQNTMYELSGLLIERLTGKRWDVFLGERLWKPLGMDETFGARGQIPGTLTHVKPYFYREEQLVQAEWDIPVDLAEAAGSVWSSLHDMGLWAQFLLRGGVTATGQRLVSETGFDEMFTPHQLASPQDFYPAIELTRPHWISYGLGWFQQDFQGRKIDFHTGSLSGLIAIIGLDRSADRAVIVLGNRDHAEMRHAVLWEVMDNSPPEQRRDWNREILALYASLAAQSDDKWADIEKQRLKGTRLSLHKDAYAGRFESAGIGYVNIVVSGDRMTLKTTNIELPMSHWHLDTFLVEYEPWNLREFAEFRIGPDGAIAGFDLFGETFTAVADPE